MEKNNKLLSWIKKHPILSIIVGLILLSSIFNLIFTPSITKNVNYEKSNYSENKIVIEPKLIDFEPVEQNNVSYLNCNRVTLKILIPDNSTSQDINYTLSYLVKYYQKSYEDITIWAYKESKKESINYTVSDYKKEYSNC